MEIRLLIKGKPEGETAISTVPHTVDYKHVTMTSHTECNTEQTELCREGRGHHLAVE